MKKYIAVTGAVVCMIVLAIALGVNLPGFAETGSSKDPSGKISIYDASTKETVLMEKIRKPESEWKKELSEQAYYVTRKKGTERAFTGKYHDNKEKGMYQCVACGTDLFSSETKFDSGTGWPSYWEPVSKNNIELEEDRSLFSVRTEVLCARCDAHLGHVFDDGPAPTGKRYCINSAALQFKKA